MRPLVSTGSCNGKLAFPGFRMTVLQAELATEREEDMLYIRNCKYRDANAHPIKYILPRYR